MSKSFVSSAKCVICGRDFPPEYLDLAYTCPDHGQEGILDIRYNYMEAGKLFPLEGQAGLWRYRALLPLPLDAPTPPLLTGMTPLYDSHVLAAELGLGKVWVKDETRQPTASLKDRASCLAVALAKFRGASVTATASTGNAAAALAGMAAAMRQRCVIFVPNCAPSSKLAQLMAYGAQVFLVEGSYDQAFDLCMQACAEKGWYNRNTGYNPCMAEGKKTVVFEICEELGWQSPDAVFVGVGDGCIMAGLHKGFLDLLALGLIARLPRLYGVQAAGSDFMHRAWLEKCFTPRQILEKEPISARTVADSISAGLPRDRIKAMNAIRESGGAFVRVEDIDILQAIPDLAGACGVFAEPAGAACLAGLRAAMASGLVHKGESVCLLATGSGLKDVAAVSNAPRPIEPLKISPDQNGLAQALEYVERQKLPKTLF